MPAADRVVERRSLLLAAGLELLGTHGLSGTTVRGVCAQARLNARYFYESFPDLDALVVAVFDDVVDQLRVCVTEAVEAAGDDPVGRVRAMVASTAAYVDSDRRRAQVLYIEGRDQAHLQRRRVESSSLIVDLVATEAAGQQPGPTHRVVASVLVGGFSELLIRWLDGQIPLERGQLVDAATELFLAIGRVGARLSSAADTGHGQDVAVTDGRDRKSVQT
ncbi:TetR family transcriptional regulator [Antricoccus suffuscus]|uniref:TetR family transcriptional regulator n=1 Tax=Antricoccus suffuscus TaxID=1629062 RepID=A0A2T1A360_9ACTN|nr:TetR family transcriptional regulator [Antricoccus suffuscus]PRZ43040.1 TetR family transcriptional regulator [Antricoccus suffuscus]